MRLPILGRTLICAAVLLFFTNFAAAQEQNKLIDIPPGLSIAHLINNSSDSKPDLIVKAWRENMNLHSFYDITFLEGDGSFKTHKLTGHEKIGRDDNITWIPDLSPVNIIGVQDEKGMVSEQIASSGDNENCMRHDYRLLFKNEKTFLIEGTKKEGIPLCGNPQEVDFKIYKIVENNTKDTYEFAPKYNFKPEKTITVQNKYDDIEPAFDMESALIIKSAKQ